MVRSKLYLLYEEIPDLDELLVQDLDDTRVQATRDVEESRLHLLLDQLSLLVLGQLQHLVVELAELLLLNVGLHHALTLLLRPQELRLGVCQACLRVLKLKLQVQVLEGVVLLQAWQVFVERVDIAFAVKSAILRFLVL